MIEVRAPSRLHFGLLAFNQAEARQFGGVGLMIDRPDVLLRVGEQDRAAGFSGEGPMSDRAVDIAERFAQRAVAAGLVPEVPAAHLHVVRVPRPHAGFGSGTQVAMAVGRALAALVGRQDLDAATLAGLVGRGRRSAIGAHGSFVGGLVIDGGKTESSKLSPLVMRHAFPEDWRIVLIRPHRLHGISGRREQQAFDRLPPIPTDMTARMCRLVLLGLAPAVVERDAMAFGDALYELQQLAGACFKSAQGGVYADPLLEDIVAFVRECGVRGVGQSSWGPTLYAVTDGQDDALRLAGRCQRQFDLSAPEVVITRADNRGAQVERRSAVATRVSG